MRNTKTKIKRSNVRRNERIKSDAPNNKECRGKGRVSVEETSHKYNDVSWYSKNPQMLADAASYSYNNPVGTGILPSGLFDGTGGALENNLSGAAKSVPSLMGLQFIPCIGVSKDSTSAANLAAQNIYSYVRYMNSGAKNYDQADLMLYLLSMDSIYMMWNWLKRVYGYVRYYSQYNRTVPNVFGVADGIDTADFQQNMADYRYRLNALAARISSFCVPAVMPLFLRHSWMVSNIYKDADNEKAQMYMFVPRICYQYDETGSANGGQLKAISIRSSTNAPQKLTEFLNIMESQLSSVAYSEDIGVMSGDVLKAYGQDKLFKISPIDPDYMVTPVYNEEVLNQIHNSSLVEHNITWGTSGAEVSILNVTQNPDSGYIVYNPNIPIRANTLVPSDKVFINMPWDNVTAANTMVGTRLCTLMNYNSNNTASFDALGSEWICARHMYVFNPTSSSYDTFLARGAYVVDSSATTGLNTIGSVLAQIAVMSNFDWHPLVPVGVLSTTNSVNTITISGIIGDITNYTTIDFDALANMHISALMSEFNVPQIGSF